eukprot:TRINITY_DN14740_c0_g1_i2.p1 TRINITY_DN14740_c0_g1~~TRINITY_DN14740_c0_g1_i2.p1  ORF type:complete len:539 (+),score=14.62 TRINITY_DN14740_c0_g1_i2:89-1618(+)
MYISDGDVHMKLEGVYLRPFGHLRMVLSSSSGSDASDLDEDATSNTYPLGLHDTTTDSPHRTPNHPSVVEMAKNCKIRMITHVSPAVWEWRNGVQEHVPSQMQGFVESVREAGSDASKAAAATGPTTVATTPSDSPLAVGNRIGKVGEFWEADGAVLEGDEEGGGKPLVVDGDEGDDQSPCFATLRINATAVDLEAYYNKAVNYTLMVTFVSFLQVLFIIRQMEHSNTQSGAARVSMLTVGQQAIMDAYLCLLHLTAGIVVGAESLFNAFATAAFFKFVIFSIFEMRYLLAIWKARRPAQSGESWDMMRRELSILYSRFYGFLLGGILLIYRFSTALRYLLLLFYSFWIPQIVTSVIRDSRKPLHVHYILGISLTRLAIPLYIFGCPKNFMRVEPSFAWCATLVTFLGAQVAMLLLQHYLGPRWFIPRQFLPEKYSYFRRVACITRQCSESDDGTSTDCVICMTQVPISAHTVDRMVTPCDHVFHSGCLQRWMDIKMECPTCRRPLPPV